MCFYHMLRFGAVVILAIVTFAAASGCKPRKNSTKASHSPDVKLSSSQDSPEIQKAKEENFEWQQQTLGEAYDKVGIKDPKWDSYARSSLKIFAQMRAYGVKVDGYPDVAGASAARAVQLGCKDPMIGYINVRLGKWDSLSRKDYAKLYTDVSDSLEGSSYPEIRKYYAAIRAYNALWNIKPLPEREAYSYLSRAAQHLYAVVADPKVPAPEVEEISGEFLTLNKWGDLKEMYDPLEVLLEKNWNKHAFCYRLQGQFYLDYAWRGRTGKYAKDVSDNQWKMFNERLAISEQRLLKAISMDPKDARMPTLMIKVAAGQNKGLAEMQQWWEKAMERNTNNYDACDHMVFYLMPSWYGDRDAMIEFARKCADSDKFGGTVPLILPDAHWKYNSYYGPKDGSYWKRPDVWPDIKRAFEKFFRNNPDSQGWHHNYAWYAYACEQWDVVNQEVALMGTDINYEYFGGEKEFDKMVARAKEEMAKKQ